MYVCTTITCTTVSRSYRIHMLPVELLVKYIHVYVLVNIIVLYTYIYVLRLIVKRRILNFERSNTYCKQKPSFMYHIFNIQKHVLLNCLLLFLLVCMYVSSYKI